MLPTANVSEAENISFSSLRSDLQQKLLWAEIASAETLSHCRYCCPVETADPEGYQAVQTLCWCAGNMWQKSSQRRLLLFLLLPATLWLFCNLVFNVHSLLFVPSLQNSIQFLIQWWFSDPRFSSMHWGNTMGAIAQTKFSPGVNGDGEGASASRAVPTPVLQCCTLPGLSTHCRRKQAQPLSWCY